MQRLLSVLIMALVIFVYASSASANELSTESALGKIAKYSTPNHNISTPEENVLAYIFGGVYSFEDNSVYDSLVEKTLIENPLCLATASGLRNYIHQAEGTNGKEVNSEIYSRLATVKFMEFITQKTSTTCGPIKRAISALTQGSMDAEEVRLAAPYNCPTDNVRIYHPACLSRDSQGITGEYEDWAMTASNSDLLKLCKVAEPDSYQFSIAQQTLRLRPRARQCTGNAAAYVIAAAYHR